MQRAPCSRRPLTAIGSWYSEKSWIRSSTARLDELTRWIFKKPPSSPIDRQPLPLGARLDLGALGRIAALRLLAGALGRLRGVLVLARLAGIVRLLVASVADRV